MISIKASCIDSTAPPEQVFASEVQKLREDKFFPKEQLTLGEFFSRFLYQTASNCKQNRMSVTTLWCPPSISRRSSRAELGGRIMASFSALLEGLLPLLGVQLAGWFA